MGTNIPKASLQEAMTDHQYPDVVVNSLNRKAPPYGALSSDEKQHYPLRNPSCRSFGKSHPNCRCYGGNPEGKESHLFAEGGAVEKEYYCDANRTHRKGCEYFKDGGGVGSDSDKLEQAAQDVNAEMQNQTPADTDQQNSSPMPTPLPPPISPNAEASSQPEQDSTEPAPEAAPEPTQAPEPIGASTTQQDQTPNPADQVIARKNQNMNDIFPETQAFKSDLDNGHIQPKTYADLFHDKGILGKLGTIFGLMIGGAGAGLSKQPMLLMDMMNKEIERDLTAQQNSKTNKLNFLKVNQQARLNTAQTNLTQAEANLKDQAKSHIQMNWSGLHHLAQMTNKLDPSSPQYQQGQQVLAMLNQGVQNENYNIADRAATAGALSSYLNGGQQGGAQNTMMMKSGLLGPEMQKIGEDTEQKTVNNIPSVAGQKASRPIPQGTRDLLNDQQILDQKGKDILNFINQNKGINVKRWLPSTRKVAEQKVEEMKNFYNNSINGGALTNGRLDWYDKQFAQNPTDILPQLMGNTDKLKETINSNAMRRDTTLRSYGFNPKENNVQQESQIKTMNGAQYKKVNGGWQKVK